MSRGVFFQTDFCAMDGAARGSSLLAAAHPGKPAGKGGGVCCDSTRKSSVSQPKNQDYSWEAELQIRFTEGFYFGRS
jgi:hypothetical protein